MQNTIHQFFDIVSANWTRGLAQAGLGFALLMSIVYTITSELGASNLILLWLGALILVFPLLLLVLATWWRRKMTGSTWWLHLLAMLVIVWGILMISGLGIGSGNQAAINTAVIFFLIFYTNYAIALLAILLGWGIDYFLNRSRQQGADS